MEFAAELQASLREFTASGVVEVRENGGRVAPFSGMSWEVRGNGEKPLLHLGRISLTSRAASWRLPIAPKSGWPSPSSALAAPNRTGSNSFAGNLSAAPANSHARNSATASPTFLPSSFRMKRLNRL